MKDSDHWVTWMLVDTLIKELKDYYCAGEVVSGWSDRFESMERQVKEAIETKTHTELNQLLEECRGEIRYHQEWQREVLGKLPAEDDESGATGPLRNAFHRSAKARAKLLQEVVVGLDKYHGFSRVAEF